MTHTKNFFFTLLIACTFFIPAQVTAQNNQCTQLMNQFNDLISGMQDLGRDLCQAERELSEIYQICGYPATGCQFEQDAARLEQQLDDIRDLLNDLFLDGMDLLMRMVQAGCEIDFAQMTLTLRNAVQDAMQCP